MSLFPTGKTKQQRQFETAAMPKCHCGNVAGLGQVECRACRDAAGFKPDPGEVRRLRDDYEMGTLDAVRVSRKNAAKWRVEELDLSIREDVKAFLRDLVDTLL